MDRYDHISDLFTSSHEGNAGRSPALECRHRALGLCLGASTLSYTVVERRPSPENGAPFLEITDHGSLRHEGDPRGALQKTLEAIAIEKMDAIAVTGRALRHLVHLAAISEPEAIELAYRFVKPPGVHCPAVVSAGGETFVAYLLDEKGRICRVRSGNKCASGTGEFFIQQIRRMNVTLEQAAGWAAIDHPYPVSGRCSVFCKSDCTHATNKGVSRSEVTAGLCRMMADKILALLKKVDLRHVMLVGGVAKNATVVGYLEKAVEGLVVPKEAAFFEALGAALWAFSNPARPFPGLRGLFREEYAAFDQLPPLKENAASVTFKTMKPGVPAPGDACIVGLDVGSTTTKAVVLRQRDEAILATVYLRTEGDPVGASRRCYEALMEALSRHAPLSRIAITGLGVCGSGRQIAGLHAGTEGVVNEIIAHAAAAAHFDARVDTLFEIGGQDAKYTHFTNGVPTDYAMNEACSAGTGSFLEEAALETLGVAMTDIADIAMKGQTPPNFNDQCAAFIASDIKRALHEGVSHADVVAGLVYAICMNYLNRVKGNRPVGERVFMQGGVCCNRAVPVAMAALLGKPIVVPPLPGLMGAFGVALVVKKRMAEGILAPQRFDLYALARREVRQAGRFVCRGGRDKCDRRCEIALIEMEGRRYPFGGACNRYENIRRQVAHRPETLDLIAVRQKRVFEAFAPSRRVEDTPFPRGRVGFNRSFLMHSYYPLWATFFKELGFDVVIPGGAPPAALDHAEAAFCHPAQLAHGFFHELIHEPGGFDCLFLPHFKALPTLQKHLGAQTCPIVQAEPFYLGAAFKKPLSALKARGLRILSPLVDFSAGEAAVEAAMVAAVRPLGIAPGLARSAFGAALERQAAVTCAMKIFGEKALSELCENPGRLAVVVFGRPYNAFATEAHMGIPRKLATRGLMSLPMDALALEKAPLSVPMYWGMGQRILKAARIVRDHPQLFGLYITNFSCGPDSFLIGQFRDLMGEKPSLTLELDSHTADAGLETRIEAFLDIVTAYRQRRHPKTPSAESGVSFRPARIDPNGGAPRVVRSDGSAVALTDPRVTLLFPSMGPLGSEALRAVFKGAGFHAKVQPPADEAVLKLGRAHTSCKECLPLQLTTGSLLQYLQNGRKKDEVVVYFMPTGSGPCRFGQYAPFMERLVERHALVDVAVFSLTGENAYAGLGVRVNRRGWWAVVAAGLFEDLRAVLLAVAREKEAAMACFNRQWRSVLSVLEKGGLSDLERCLHGAARELGRTPLHTPAGKVPRVLLTGEIFVRHDPLSRRYLTEWLARQGIAALCSPVAEWLDYTDYLVGKGLTGNGARGTGRLRLAVKRFVKGRDARRIRAALTRSGLVAAEVLPVETFIENAADHISPNLTGEAVLTVGASLTEAASSVCGVIAIGPFGCMPNRVSEAILKEVMTLEEKKALPAPRLNRNLFHLEDRALPFLAVESDGFPFPQLIHAQLEAFCVQALRLNAWMRGGRR